MTAPKPGRRGLKPCARCGKLCVRPDGLCSRCCRLVARSTISDHDMVWRILNQPIRAQQERAARIASLTARVQSELDALGTYKRWRRPDAT